MPRSARQCSAMSTSDQPGACRRAEPSGVRRCSTAPPIRSVNTRPAPRSTEVWWLTVARDTPTLRDTSVVVCPSEIQVRIPALVLPSRASSDRPCLAPPRVSQPRGASVSASWLMGYTRTPGRPGSLSTVGTRQQKNEGRMQSPRPCRCTSRSTRRLIIVKTGGRQAISGCSVLRRRPISPAARVRACFALSASKRLRIRDQYGATAQSK